MKKAISIALLFSLLLFASVCFASESEGDMYTFCPALSTTYYNEILKSFLELNDTQAALLKVTSDGLKEGKQTYSDILQNTIFIFGTNSEYDIADTAFIWCSLKDSSTLKNMPMIIWAACIQMKYFGDISEGKSDFLNWVNNGLDDGDRFESPYFIAQYSETPYDNCTLLIVRK